MADAILNKQIVVLTWSVNYLGFSIDAGAKHFRSLATASTNAGVVTPLIGELSITIKGSETTTCTESPN